MPTLRFKRAVSELSPAIARLAVAWVALASALAAQADETGANPGAQVIQFEGPNPLARKVDRFIETNFDLRQEHFWIDIPPRYDGTVKWGLIVFMSPREEMTALFPGWDQVLQEKHLQDYVFEGLTVARLILQDGVLQTKCSYVLTAPCLFVAGNGYSHGRNTSRAWPNCAGRSG